MGQRVALKGRQGLSTTLSRSSTDLPTGTFPHIQGPEMSLPQLFPPCLGNKRGNSVGSTHSLFPLATPAPICPFQMEQSPFCNSHRPQPVTHRDAGASSGQCCPRTHFPAGKPAQPPGEKRMLVSLGATGPRGEREVGAWLARPCPFKGGRSARKFVNGCPRPRRARHPPGQSAREPQGRSPRTALS